MSHIDHELNTTPAFGWTVDIMGMLDVEGLRSGMEVRNQPNARTVRRFMLPFLNIQEQAYLDDLSLLFEATGCGLHTFLARDYSFDEVTAASLGNAPSGSTPVQLVIRRTVGALTHVRKITRPRAAGFVLYQNGVAKAGTLDTSTGLFTPSTAWTAGQPLSWSGGFRIPVRFRNSSLPMSIDNRSGDKYVMNGSVELIEVLE